MKHGHKTETVTAKVKKASGGKSSVSTASRAGGKSEETAARKGSVKAPRAKAGSKAAPVPEGKDGFSSEDVAAAYARAIEKYAVAFKRVTD